MGYFTLPWGLAGALLAATYLRSVCVTASPSINVGLKAAFSSAPYLLELLETAADQNATSYFPLLDRIADGYFGRASTDKELYEQFIQVLEVDGHMLDSETLSTYQFALSMRSSAPRIEAHYQYYHTAAEPSLKEEQDSSCPVWVLFGGKQYCSPALDQPHGDCNGKSQLEELPFDRVLGNPSKPASILYADITSPTFGQFHKTLSKTARDGKTSYRIRHRKSLFPNSKPLVIPGYGVELALKRTDYIVIDDRDDEDRTVKSATKAEVKFEDETFADLKPLSTSELFDLSLKASSFIMQSENPFETLVKLSQDFPKYSSAVASHNATEEFVAEHNYNREQLGPAGYNVWWMNGVQLTERDIEALRLLEILRKERKLINGVRDLGFTSAEAIKLLAHPDVATVKTEDEPQRFDWRDDKEGGKVIIWMNDIEKDKRYADWPDALGAFLQRTYPGQLPPVRRDCFNIIVPVDFTSSEDIRLIVDTFLGFVQRKLPIRIGLVPITPSPQATEQAKVVYHLLDTYGLSSVFAYLEIISSATPLIAASKAGFESSIEGKKTRVDKVALSLEDVFKSEDYELKTHASQNWIRRLSADTQIPPMFVDGAAFPRDENYLQSMSTRITADLSAIQNAIFKESFADDTWLPDYFLAGAAKKRNTLVVPEDEKALKVFDLNKILGDSPETLHILPRVQPDPSSDKADWAHLIVITDLDSDAGEKLLTTASIFREANPSVELVIVHNPASSGSESGLSSHLFSHMQSTANKPFQGINDLVALLAADVSKDIKADKANSEAYWQAATTLLKSITLRPGESGFLLDGRLVGPIPDSPEFAQEDLDQLLAYERSKRITPALKAIVDLGLAERIKCPLSAAKVTSIVAISTISDIPPGIHEQAPLIRMGQFDIWNTSHTLIEVGDVTTASIQVTILLDPASELGQRWTPMLKILSQLDGIYMKIFLNPKERLSELPIKRFYRYVLGSKPTFDDAGALENFGASFTGVPQEALLTVGLDIPPAWLVGPEISVYDLDNIKLSSIKTNVEALYKLEYILIEGHSREMPSSAAPRGAQLVLGTERDPHFADTIIMANLGYFQFKANPGFYKISLQEGRSSEIFSIDSIGSHGWTPVAGDESTEVVLMSFQGATIYPRLSRNSGAEAEDVLEAKSDSPLDFVSRGLNFAQGMLGSKGKAVKQAEQAEINIFSVASGHLYERMLNIMMVSVMKHTKHTVKFWFIEQFLSPSFKDFIPFLAAEYGFKYEMVTYKWPHWLRGQKEKQREIWGYKILFLDVLFPLSLDKVIFVDADQIVRTDMIELVNHDLKGAPYGFTPMCDSRTEMEGFRFWKQGYWEKFLRGFPYHISALYVVDLQRFRQMAAGDRLRQQYHQLSADPNSLSNLDQDLPNHMQAHLPIHSLPQEWLWCETWCSNESLKEAKTIDLCNNPLTKEPKLDRARRQVPEWTMYDDEIAAVDKRRRGNGIGSESGNEEKNIKSRTLEVESTSKKDEL